VVEHRSGTAAQNAFLFGAKGIRVVLSGAFAVAVAAASLVVGAPSVGAQQPGLQRLEADTPIEAGLSVSQDVFADDSTNQVILVRSGEFPDALLAGPLAGELPNLAPILLTPEDSLDSRVANELDRVTGGSGMVHLIGGEAALDPAVEQAVTDRGYATQRVGGQTRVGTALALFNTYFADDVNGGDVLVARAFGDQPDESDAWPDSLTGGGFAAARGIPLLLTPRDGPPAAVTSALEDSAAGAALILGGEVAVPASVEQRLASQGLETLRAGGATREGTAVAVAKKLYGIDGLAARDTALVVNGRKNFAYGLAAAAYAANGTPSGLEAPLLLVGTDSPSSADECGEPTLGAPAVCYLSQDSSEAGPIVVVGGGGQVSSQAAQALQNARN
jgi:putative cell wall-binding protein